MQAEQHWNSISSTCQVPIIGKHDESLQFLSKVDELCITAFAGPDKMQDVMDDIEMIFDWFHTITYLGFCFTVPVYMFESLAIFVISTAPGNYHSEAPIMCPNVVYLAYPKWSWNVA